MVTVMPMAKLTMTLVMVCRTWDPVDTPEISAAVAKRPTTNKSTAPYMACKNRSRMTGNININKGFTIGPVVKEFFTVVSMMSSLK